jgi:hypothetical protein
MPPLRHLLALFTILCSPAAGQVGDFEFCSPGPGAINCLPETWGTNGGTLTVGPTASVPAQLGFPSSGAQWLIVEAAGASGSINSPAGGPASYPFTPGSTGNLIFKNVVLNSTIAFDWNVMFQECPQESSYNDFFSADIVDTVTGKSVANMIYLDTWSAGMVQPSLTPNGIGTKATNCGGGLEAAPTGVAKAMLYIVPLALVGGTYNVEFHIGNGFDNAFPGWAWIDNVKIGSAGSVGTCTSRSGVLGTNPTGYDCVLPPYSGINWITSIEQGPSVGTGTLATIVLMGLGGATDNTPLGDFELLCLPPYLMDFGMGQHSFPVPPGMTGLTLATQGARIETDGLGSVIIVMTNGQDLLIG